MPTRCRRFHTEVMAPAALSPFPQTWGSRRPSTADPARRTRLQVPMASPVPSCAARPVCAEASEDGTRGGCPRRRRWGPPGGRAESAGSSGARRVAGVLSGERAVSWSRTPVGRRAGLGRGRGPGRSAGAGRPGFRGFARATAGCGGRQDRSAGSLHP